MGMDASQAPGTDPTIARELQDLRARNDYLMQSVQQMGGYLQSEAQQRAEAQRQAEEARIANLPPQDQANERIKLVQRENQELRTWIAQQAQAQQRTQQQPRPQRQAVPQVADRQYVPMTQAQIDAKKQELVTAANAKAELSGERAITLADVPAQFHDSPEAFSAKLAELADARKAQPASEGDTVAKPAKTSAATAASAPMSPQPNAPKRNVDRADFDQVLAREHRQLGDAVVPPRQRLAALQNLRAEAATRVTRS